LEEVAVNFGDIHWLWLLWLLVPLGVLIAWSWRVRQRLLTRFINPRLLATLTAGVSKQRQKIRIALFVLAVASLIFSLARPQLGFSLEESKQAGLDIVVAIDTSKSMLADDVQPNRLQRAKLAAVDLMRLAKSDRLGLVAFAGGAFLQCPLSLDEEAFRQSVDFLDVNVIPQGGTALAEAIQTARAAFKEETENHKVLVLFTDGEDNDDAEAAIQAAREGKKAGLRIFTIGVGTPNGEVLSTKDPYGNRVFIKDSAGNVVKSRLNENLLQQIAKETDGFYLPLTGARSMDVLYERGLAPLPKSETATRTIRQYHERFQWFIGAALLLLLTEMMFPERSPTPGPKSHVQSPRPTAGTTVSIVLLCCAAQAFGAASDALKNYARGKFSQARTEFERLARKSPDDPRLRYNAGAAAFQGEDYDTALKHFNQTLSARDLKLQEQSYYNLGNTHFRLGEKTTDAKEKQQQWEQAIHQYESALKLNTNDMDAQFNMEVVKKRLEELKKQQQQQQDKQDQNKDDQNKDDQNKDKQKSDQQKKEDKKDEQEKSEQEKQDEQKKQEQESQKKDQQSQKQDEQKQDQQQAKDERGEKSDKPSEQQNYARVMQMTPQQAQQLLDAQKSEERAMIFQPMIQRTNRPKDRVFKDW
jgi:Ca-activated chloride channel family protein